MKSQKEVEGNDKMKSRYISIGILNILNFLLFTLSHNLSKKAYAKRQIRHKAIKNGDCQNRMRVIDTFKVWSCSCGKIR